MSNISWNIQIANDVNSSTATFANTVLTIACDEDEAALSARIIGFYQAVSTDSELRNASSKAEEMMDEFNIEASMRDDIFELVDAAWKVEKERNDLDEESKRLLEKERKSYIRNGLGIEKGPKRDRFKEIKKRLSQVCGGGAASHFLPFDCWNRVGYRSTDFTRFQSSSRRTSTKRITVSGSRERNSRVFLRMFSKILKRALEIMRVNCDLRSSIRICSLR
jgi:hypothetical protein